MILATKVLQQRRNKAEKGCHATETSLINSTCTLLFFVISENKHVQFIQYTVVYSCAWIKDRPGWRENQCSRAYNIILLSKKIQT